jgi:hypothetical protein
MDETGPSFDQPCQQRLDKLRMEALFLSGLELNV